MRVLSLSFTDRRTQWELETAHFDDFNLLVGISGVGKTKILDALERVSQVATRADHNLAEANGVTWAIRVEHEKKTFLWEVQTSLVRNTLDDKEKEPDERKSLRESPEIVSEKITRNGGEVLLDRNQQQFSFGDKELPKLKQTDSALVLLADAEPIATLSRGFRRFLYEQRTPYWVPFDTEDLDRMKRKHGTLDRLRDATQIPDVMKAYLLQELFPGEFNRIRDLFTQIFSTVEDVRVRKSSEDPDFEEPYARPYYKDALRLCIKERGVSPWIPQGAVSSGMMRTLQLLIEISLAPPGTVILIDEFENSLGKNCMIEVTDFIQSKTADVQFILTSHHPYIINNLPIKTWKLVQRRGSHIRVVPSVDIPAIQGASHHETFIRLINLREYEEGIQ